MVNWKQVVEDDLRKYEGLKEAVKCNEAHLELLSAELAGVKAVDFDAMPKADGQANDPTINALVMKLELEERLNLNRRRVALIEKGLAGLDSEERLALDYFYIYGYRDAADKLCEVLNVERSTAYNIRNRARNKYTLACYGIV